MRNLALEFETCILAGGLIEVGDLHQHFVHVEPHQTAFSARIETRQAQDGVEGRKDAVDLFHRLYKRLAGGGL